MNDSAQAQTKAPSYFSLDLRALAVFRMALGAVFVLDLLLRYRDLQMFYGDDGVLSRALFLKQSWLLWEYQVFMSTGSTWGLTLFFGLGVAAGICLLVGYRARWAALFCWLFTVSLQLRNPLILDGGDELLRLLLFWCPFLPLSARWSVGARHNPEWQSLSNNYRSIATTGIYLQFVLLYFFAALLKTGDEWRVNGEALYYALSIDQFATHLGKALLEYPDFLRLLTRCVVPLEFLLAITLLIPARWNAPRYIFLVLATGFHLGIALTLHFGIFMLIVACGLTAFLPGTLLDRWAPGGDHSPQEGDSQPPAYRLSLATKVFSGFILFYMVFVNIQSVKHRHRLPGWTMVVARLTYQHQHWHLFAPRPFLDDGWFVFEVTDDQGNVSKELSDIPKPAHVSTTFPNQRWRRWFQNMVQADLEDVQSWRNSTAHYLAKSWLRNNPDRGIKSYRLLFLEEMTPPPGEKAKVELKVLAESVKS